MKQIITDDVLQKALKSYANKDHAHSIVTQSKDGFMSKEDKIKLDGMSKSNFLGNNTGYVCPYRNGSNLNTITREFHGFVMNVLNGPESNCHGFLDVTWYDGTGFDLSTTGVIRQRFTIYSTGVEYVRCLFGTTWTSWQRTANVDPLITGVKGNNESKYRTGNVNLTCSNIGAASANHTHSNYINKYTGDFYDGWENEFFNINAGVLFVYDISYSISNRGNVTHHTEQNIIALFKTDHVQFVDSSCIFNIEYESGNICYVKLPTLEDAPNGYPYNASGVWFAICM